MLKALQRAVGVKAEDVAGQVIALAAHEALQTEFAEFKTTAEAAIAGLTAEKEAGIAALADAQAALAEATAQLETLKEFAAAAEAEKARLVAEAEALRLNTRKEKITAAVGTERADALMAATQALDDAAFDAIVSAMNLSVVAEAKTDLFVEQGAAAEADAAKTIDESPEMKILKAKYGQK